MLKAIITYLNLKLELLNYFDLTRCLVELKESETDNGILKQPVEYISNGEFDVINFDEFNGVSYWRLRDEPSTDRTETQKYRAGAKNNIETTIPLRLVFAVPRKKLTEDDAYSFDRIRQTMVKQFAIDDEVLKNQLGAISVRITQVGSNSKPKEVWEEETEGTGTFEPKYETVFGSIDVDVVIISDHECLPTECDDVESDVIRAFDWCGNTALTIGRLTPAQQTCISDYLCGSPDPVQIQVNGVNTETADAGTTYNQEIQNSAGTAIGTAANPSVVPDARIGANGNFLSQVPATVDSTIDVHDTAGSDVGSQNGTTWEIGDTTIRNQANDWSDTELAEGTYTLGLQRVVDSDGSNVDTVDYKPIADGAAFTCTPSASVSLGAFSDAGYSNPVTEADFHDTVYLRAVPSNITPSGFDFFLDNGTDATIIVSGDADGEYTWTVTELADVWNMKVFADTVCNSLEFTINNDPDVQDFLDATGITDSGITLALNYLVCELKDGGLWDRLNAVYPFVGGTATTHKFNLKDPRDLDAAFRLVFNGGITHSATGVKGNGTNGWIDTHLVPSSVSSANDEHISIYSRTNDNGLRVDMGADTPTIKSNIISRYLGDFYARMQGTNTTGDAVADSLGLFVANRINSSEAEGYYNGTQFTKSNAQVGLPNISYHIMALNSNGTAAFFSQREIAFATQGGGISVADELVLRTAIDNFQTRLGRNV